MLQAAVAPAVRKGSAGVCANLGDTELVLCSRGATSLEKAVLFPFVLLVCNPLVHGQCFSDPPMLVTELYLFM